MITNYQQAVTYLGTKADRPLPGRATRLQRRTAESIAVRYQATDVVTYYADGRIVLDSGGYRTMTTKARINEYSPACLWQARGLWYLSVGNCGSGEERADARQLFADGVTLHADGTVAGTLFPNETEAAKRRLDRLVREYIRGYCAHVADARTLQGPGGGDCWGCYFQQAEGHTAPVEVMGVDHYLSHFQDRYYVPSLLVRAIVTRGYGSPGVIWAMIAGEAERGETRMLADVLRAFFRKIKPALLSELQRGTTAA